ncbi:MAG: hypothetical protein RXN91_08600, partial [Caldivirga sp.]
STSILTSLDALTPRTVTLTYTKPMPVNYLFINYKCFLRYGISIGFLEVMAMVWSIGRLKEVRDVELLVNNIRSPASKLFK